MQNVIQLHIQSNKKDHYGITTTLFYTIILSQSCSNN